MIKESLKGLFSFILITNFALAQDHYSQEQNLDKRNLLEIDYLRSMLAPPVVTASNDSEEIGEGEEIEDQVETVAAAPEKKAEDNDEDFVLPLEQEMFGEKESKPSRIRPHKKSESENSNHKRRLR